MYKADMKITRLSQAYDFPGFKALSKVEELSYSTGTIIITLKRSYEKKDLYAHAVGAGIHIGMTRVGNKSEILTAVISEFILILRYGGYIARSAAW